MPTTQSLPPTTIDVTLRRVVDESYPVMIGQGLSQQIVAFATSGKLAGYRPVIITDDTVRVGLAQTLRQQFAQAGHTVEVLSFPAGEGSKTRATKQRLEDHLIAARYGRDTVILAVGGGVVTDLAGFTAATFTRGVPLITVPTTFLAAADASIGGKTGVDTPAATNLIGAFHQPAAVFIDLDTLASLPEEHIRTGLAETIKHACIADADLFATLEDAFLIRQISLSQFVADTNLCRHVAIRNAEIKRDFVTADVHEADLRMVLNLGHTFGRALEAAVNFTLPHGQAVAIGLMLQAQWGLDFGVVTQQELARLQALLQAVGLPIRLPETVTTPALLEAMSLDKKARAQTIRFVHQRGIGAYQTFAGAQPCPPQHPQARTTRPASTAEIEQFLAQARAAS